MIQNAAPLPSFRDSALPKVNEMLRLTRKRQRNPSHDFISPATQNQICQIHAHTANFVPVARNVLN